MRRLLPLILFAIFSYDIVVDSFDAECADLLQAEACHTCVCQVHFTDTSEARSTPLIAPTGPLEQATFIPALSISDKSFFHPPKTRA